MAKGKKLKREDYLFLNDESFNWIQEANAMDDEGFNAG